MEAEDAQIPPPPPRLEQPRNGGNQMFMSPRNQRDRDVWAAHRWTKDNWSFQQIADALELSHRSNARPYVERGLRAIGAPTEQAASEARAIQRARLEAAIDVAFEVMAKDHIQVSQGRVVKDEAGVPLIDDGPKLAAADRIRALSESLRKLDGLDAATKTEANVTVNPQDIELAEIIRRTEAANEARETRIKGDNADV